MNSLLAGTHRSRVADISSSDDPALAASAECARLWSLGAPPAIEELWARHSPDGSVPVLAAIVKADLKARFDREERPSVAAYLERFPALRDARERVVSLVYEEYCLREETGEALNADSFCARYDAWRDSLLSQIRYHEVLSRAIGIDRTKPRRFPALGERWRSFRLDSILGEGQLARVYLAIDETLGERPIALKISTDRGLEAAIQGRLDHEHIVPVHSVVDDPETGLRGLAMPYRPGLPLDEVIRRIDPVSRPRSAAALRSVLVGKNQSKTGDDLPAGWQGFPFNGTYAQGVAWIGSVIARALAHAHSQGVLHRDVKPANVLLTAHSGPQLLDFNLSHSPHAADRAEAALRGGTLPYMAPEQLAAFLDPVGWDNVGEAADVYSLGLVLREMLTGVRPEAPDPNSPLPRAIAEFLDRRSLGFTPARAANPDVPYGLQAIIDRCLACNPARRYTSARALADDLQKFVERKPTIEVTNPSRKERVLDWLSHQRPSRVASFAAVAVSLVLAYPLYRVLASQPDAGAYVSVARDFLEKKDYLQAESRANRAIAIDPRSFPAYWTRADARAAQGDLDAAVDDIEMAVRIAEARGASVPRAHMATLLLDSAKLHERVKRIDDAKAAYRRALEVYNVCYPAHAGLAQFADSEGDYARAIDHLNEAIRLIQRLRPEHLDATLATYCRQRANARVNLGRKAHSAKVIDQAMPIFLQAYEDVSLARKGADALNDEERTNLEFAEFQVNMALGDGTSAPDDYPGALVFYTKAERHLEEAEKRGCADGLTKRARGDLTLRLEDTRRQLVKALSPAL